MIIESIQQVRVDGDKHFTLLHSYDSLLKKKDYVVDLIMFQ